MKMKPKCNKKLNKENSNKLPQKLIAEWDYEKNGDLRPEDVTAGSHKRVHWKCKEYGHEWDIYVYSRALKGNNCPYCSNQKLLVGFNDLETAYPDIAATWCYEKNGDLKPTDIKYSSHKQYYWKCKEKGHIWRTSVNHRVGGTGCPKCVENLKISFAEKIIFYYFKKAFPDAVENYKADWLNFMELDIFIPSLNIGIEYDGTKWHQDVKRDNRKNNFCKSNNVLLFRLREPNCPKTNSNSINYVFKEIKNNGTHVKEGIEFIIKKIDKNISLDVDIIRDTPDIYNLMNTSIKMNSVKDSKLIEEWDFEKNRDLNPEYLSRYSNINAHWKCKKCGHKWSARIDNRSSGRGCPCCSGQIVVEGINDLATIYSELASKWDYDRNKGLLPTEVSPGSHKKVYWTDRKSPSAICNRVRPYRTKNLKEVFS